MKPVLAIDPGPVQSAYVVLRDGRHTDFKKCENDAMKALIAANEWQAATVVIEKVESYGMAVGADIFKTVWWSGRFWEVAEVAGYKCEEMPRRVVKLHLCNNSRAKDKNIITALVDRYDPDRAYGAYGKGTKKNQGPFYDFAGDVWQAMAVGVTFADGLLR